MPPKKQNKTEPQLADSYRIYGVQADNFLRLKTANVRFDPDSSMVILSGKNEQGKTSLLQAIWVALGGPKIAPKEVVRDDAERAELVVDLVPAEDPQFDSPGRIRVCRSISQGGKWSLKIYADGRTNPFRSPQALLDQFFNHLAFDPSEFLRMKPEKQQQVVIQLGGVEDQVKKLKDKRQEVYDERTAANTLVRNAQAAVDRLPQPRPGGQVEEVNTKELLTQLDQRREQRRQNEEQREKLQQLYAEHAELGQQITDAEAELAALQARLEDLRSRQQQVKENGKAQKEVIAALVEPDTQEIEERLAQVDQLNLEARQAREYREAKEELAEHESRAESLTNDLSDIDTQIRTVLAGGKLPIEGLEIREDGGVYFEGRPFEQASSARRLEISLAMGAAMHPRLKFLSLQEASMMDEGTRARVQAWAEEHGFFVLMELATSERIGIHIVDGEIETPKQEDPGVQQAV